MKFKLKEWNEIREALRIAAEEYRKTRDDCKPSDDENSSYQIFERQAARIDVLIAKIDENKF